MNFCLKKSIFLREHLQHENFGVRFFTQKILQGGTLVFRPKNRQNGKKSEFLTVYNTIKIPKIIYAPPKNLNQKHFFFAVKQIIRK